jgi:integrase
MPGVRETEPVKPVPEVFVNAAQPFMPPPVRAMVELQLLTGMRPGETCIIRAIDIDMTGRVWIYRPATHKTAHHGHERTVCLGPKAQEVIRPWLALDATAFLFSPAKAEAARNAQRRKERETPLWPSHQRRLERKRRTAPKRAKQDRYDEASCRRAIKRACAKADNLAHEEQPAVSFDEVIIPTWHPHQLRHNAATSLRREYGVELARIILGHATAFTTEIYAEVDQQQAIEVIAKIG